MLSLGSPPAVASGLTACSGPLRSLIGSQIRHNVISGIYHVPAVLSGVAAKLIKAQSSDSRVAPCSAA
jgi:hypothetical protein